MEDVRRIKYNDLSLTAKTRANNKTAIDLKES